MRIIKFRGKNNYNEWSYGNIVKVDGRHQIQTEDEYFEYVYSKTIGQFTGLTDKNGVDIYEGDIIKFESDWDNHIITVKFYNGAFRVGTEISGVLGINDFDPIHEIYNLSVCDIEIIGNIHENPELLEEE